MSERRVVLIGAGAGGLFTTDICRAAGREVHGYLDDGKEKGSRINDTPVLGPCSTVEEDDQLVREFDFIITLGVFPLRRRLFRIIRERDGRLASVIHPATSISPSAKIGANVVVNAFAVVSPNAKIGDLVLIEDHSSIGNGCILGDNTLLAIGVRMGSGVVCEGDIFLGMGAIVVNNTTIGRRSYIGAGAVVTGDIPEGKLAVGVPAKVIKDSPIP